MSASDGGSHAPALSRLLTSSLALADDRVGQFQSTTGYGKDVS